MTDQMTITETVYTGDAQLLEDFLMSRRHLGVRWSSRCTWWMLFWHYTKYTITAPQEIVDRLKDDLLQWHEDRALLDGRGGF